MDAAQHRAASRSFAVVNVGANRWYWSVWPAQSEARRDGSQVVIGEGIEPSKLEAIDCALRVGGADATWTLAKYARQQYKNRGKSAEGQIDSVRWLYHDIYDAQAKVWRSDWHQIVKTTAAYVWIDPVADARQGTQDGRGWQGEQPVRLARAMLDRDGYAAVSLAVADRFGYDDPFFFSTPIEQRATGDTGMEEALVHLGLPVGATQAEIRRAYRRLAKAVHPDRGGSHAQFIALQQAYRQTLANSREQ